MSSCQAFLQAGSISGMAVGDLVGALFDGLAGPAASLEDLLQGCRDPAWALDVAEAVLRRTGDVQRVMGGLAGQGIHPLSLFLRDSGTSLRSWVNANPVLKEQIFAARNAQFPRWGRAFMVDRWSPPRALVDAEAPARLILPAGTKRLIFQDSCLTGIGLDGAGVGLKVTACEGVLDLPGLVCGNLKLTYCEAEFRFPARMMVDGRVEIRGCQLDELPAGLCARGLAVEDCPRLERLPRRIAGDLTLSHLPSLRALPDRLTVQGDLTIQACPRLRDLPPGMVVKGTVTFGKGPRPAPPGPHPPPFVASAAPSCAPEHP